MSKSVGNIITPETIVKQYGADILRLWVAQTDFTEDQRIGPEILKGVSDSYRRLRNTLRFILGALDQFDESKTIAPDEMPELERWVLGRMAEVHQEVGAAYRNFAYRRAFETIFEFCTSDLSAFYFDIRKDSLYCDQKHANSRQACQTVLDLLHRYLTHWLAPLLPFTMEDVYLTRLIDAGHPIEGKSVHLEESPVALPTIDTDLMEKIAKLRSLRRVVTAALEQPRREKVIGSSLEAAPQVYVASEDDFALLKKTNFAEMCITSSISVHCGDAPESAFCLPEMDGVAVIFTLAQGKKCERCWKIMPDLVDLNLCQRCETAIPV